MAAKAKDPLSAIQKTHSILWMSLCFTIIFIVMGSYSYFEKPIGLPCKFATRTGILKKTANSDFLLDGTHQYALSWPLRHGHGGAWNALENARNGMHVQSQVCGNDLVRVFLEGREVFVIHSRDTRAENVASAKLAFGMAFFCLVLMTTMRYRLKHLRA
ncbi:hypothetical protein RJO15_04915 [Herbaspirillum huttiense F1]|jgi:hypothetical protein|uniref:DUF3592 domain-containing protein n=1 Tax=Herbaspirillum huttiense subsp. lycopersici TaxID=3074428 RepID=A0ABU2EIC7_9BURK|nr:MULTISPECIES: hypothetical protein [Herbaspirillum]MBP1313630.1 hypothetical protein [Herbaspirillum sp. 1130]MDR6738846.1 hypothetical protein [Herbaspirillum sp. 1173]MDR9847625.1 hypothetical protein [Herbaspirillum huttiense SE1]MDT0355101.1 hypothetical protein [Herbaspirillum huttiense F1]